MECELVLGRDDPKPIPENNNNNGVGRGTLDCLLLVALQKLRFSPEFEEDKNSDFCILIADISCKKMRSVMFRKFRSGQENNRNLFSVKIIMSTMLYLFTIINIQVLAFIKYTKI